MVLKDYNANIKYLELTPDKRAWGIETRVVLFDAKNPVADSKHPDFEFGFEALKTITIPSKKIMSAVDLASERNRRIASYIIEKANPPVEIVTYTKEEVEDILITKKYLASGQQFPTDLPTKTVTQK